eukprot:267923_1
MITNSHGTDSPHIPPNCEERNRPISPTSLDDQSQIRIKQKHQNTSQSLLNTSPSCCAHDTTIDHRREDFIPIDSTNTKATQHEDGVDDDESSVLVGIETAGFIPNLNNNKPKAMDVRSPSTQTGIETSGFSPNQDNTNTSQETEHTQIETEHTIRDEGGNRFIIRDNNILEPALSDDSSNSSFDGFEQDRARWEENQRNTNAYLKRIDENHEVDADEDTDDEHKSMDLDPYATSFEPSNASNIVLNSDFVPSNISHIPCLPSINLCPMNLQQEIESATSSVDHGGTHNSSHIGNDLLGSHIQSQDNQNNISSIIDRSRVSIYSSAIANTDIPSQERQSYVSLSQTANYVDRISHGASVRWYCPLDGQICDYKCDKAATATTFSGYKSVAGLHAHMRKHCMTQDEMDLIPAMFWSSHKREWCGACAKLYAYCNRTKHRDCGDLEDDGDTGIAEPEVILDQMVQIPDIDTISRYRTQMCIDIPIPLHRQWNDCILALLNDINNDDSLRNWKRWFIMPRVIFHCSKRGGKGHFKRKMNAWRRRMDLWQSGEYIALWQEYVAEFEQQQIIMKRQQPEVGLDPKEASFQQRIKEKNAKTGIHYARNADLSGGMRAMFSYGMMRIDDDTIELIQELHPEEPEIVIDPNEVIETAPLQLLPKETKDSIQRYKKTKAAGPDGWRPYYFNPILKDYKERAILCALTDVSNMILRGDLSNDDNWFGSANGTLLAKDELQSKGRPLAAGIAIRRIITRAMVKRCIPDIGKIVYPFQIGAEKNGSELLVHTLRATASLFEEDPELSFMSVDEKNAFNCMYRSATRPVIKIYTPHLLPYWDTCYKNWSKIYYGTNHVITSKRGWQQGDGFAGFGFGLVLYHYFKEEPEMLNKLLNMWYHDDGGIIAPYSDMESMGDLIFDLSRRVGLQLNRDKTTIYTQIPDPPPTFDCTVVNELNFEIVGSYIGSDIKTEQWLDSKLDDYRRLFETISLIDDPQIQASYIYYCCNYGKIMYLMRTIPSHLLITFCRNYDELILYYFERLIQSPITQMTWDQISLSHRNGGMGMRASKHHTIAAYSSSVGQCLDRMEANLVHRIETFDLYNDHGMNALTEREFKHAMSDYFEVSEALGEEYGLDESELKNQRLISQKIDDKLYDNLYGAASEFDKARLNACRGYGAACWISAIPSYSSIIGPDEFRIIVRVWLGMKIFENDASGPRMCRCCRTVEADEYGIHYQCCASTDGGKYYGRTKRHNSMRGLLYNLCKTAKYHPELEKKGLILNSYRSRSSPADVYIPIWKNGLPGALDVGITNPCAPSYVSDAADEILKVGHDYHDAKLDKYRSILDHNALCYEPFIIESYGGFTMNAQKILKRICFDLRGKYKKVFGVVVSTIRRKLVINLWRANAKMILGRIRD